MEKFYNNKINEIMEQFNTSKDKGLSEKNVVENVKKYGENKLKEKGAKTLFQQILDQFKDFLVLILIGAAIISIFLGEYFDGIVILCIVIINSILGIVQERKASNALNALKKMATPNSKVIREATLKVVSSYELVPGDIVIIEAGDYIPADIRLIDSVNLKVEEAALTGESVATLKDAKVTLDEDTQLADRINMLYMGTIVTYGRGKGVVVATGMNTQIGNIASMLNEVEEEGTPLQKKLDSLGKMLGVVCLIVCIIIFVMGYMRGEEFLSIFMTSVSLAVAAIPEGLPAVVTVVLALGMQRMITRHAIMKKLAAVETLGSTTVICTDKTGTLTQNKMVVTKIFDGQSIWDITGTGYSTAGEVKTESEVQSLNLEKILQVAVLCNDASLKKGEEDIIGDPTEGALIVLGAKGGYPKETLNKEYKRVDEYPFDSERKLMSTMHERKTDKVLYTKGAPDELLKRCKYILKDGQIKAIEKADIERINDINNKFAKTALRVLGYGYKIVKEYSDIKNEEKDLIFVGLTGMMDPPRKEAKDAISLCHKAGIRVVMITGDHKTTASAIALALGIIDSEDQSLSGSEIDNYSEKQLEDKIGNVNVFARVSPEHKVKIVSAIRASGEVAAMTGDGVNDAPALKQADIGIAMGITGTDVAKEAADMILTDDNFSSIVHAVEEGRVIYSNIRKFVGFLLSCNIGEILIIFISMLLGWGIPLLPIHLLWINLITDSLPAFSLGLEGKEEGIMTQKPRDPKESIVDKSMKISIVIQSIMLALSALIAFKYGNYIGDINTGRTFCFITLILGELIRAYSARSESRMLYKFNPFGNKYLNISFIIAIVLLFLVVYIPLFQPIFHTEALTLVQLVIGIALALIPLIGGEVAKLFK